MRSTTRRISSGLALAATAALVLAGCGDAAEPEPSPQETTVTEEPEPEPEETPDDEAPDDEAPDDEPTDGEPEGRSGDTEGTGPGDGGAAPEREGTDPVPEEELPGEDFGLYFNEQGAAVDVVGVQDGDVLFVREAPDHNAPEVGRLAPTGDAVLAGRERTVEHGLWAEVELADGVGWVNSYYLGYLAQTEDITSEFDGYGPHEDASALVAEIAQERVDERAGPSQVPEWVVVQTPEDSPVHRVDIFPFFDDATWGERLEIHLEDAAGGVALGQVQRTAICSRGVTDDGLCV